MTRADSGLLVAQGFNPGALVEQIGGAGVVAILVAVVAVIVIVKIVFSVLKKVAAVIVTLALTGALGGGVAAFASGALDRVPAFFDSLFDLMPWS